MSTKSRKAWIAGGVLLLGAGIAVVASMMAASQSHHDAIVQKAKTMEPQTTADAQSPGLQTATFGTGCFWCTEAVFLELKGVHSVVSGFSGGHVENPTYKQVVTGTTGHAEVVQLQYDPEVIAYDELLEVFWKVHDPTTPDRQGNDVGPQYRSAIFYHNEHQKERAEHYKTELDRSGAFPAPIVTEITPFTAFYPAEDYHQNYFALNARQPYCYAVIRPKLEKFRKVFKDKLKASAKPIEKITKTDDEWRRILTPTQFEVTRRAGTERAFTGEYWDNHAKGIYSCVGCDLTLFDSATKFKSGTGWPSFFQPIDPRHVELEEDASLFTVRTEVKCPRCGAHLGHVFDDGPAPTGLRYCMNSAALKFHPEKD